MQPFSTEACASSRTVPVGSVFQMDLHWELPNVLPLDQSQSANLGKKREILHDSRSLKGNGKPKRKRTASLKDLCPEDKKRVANLIHHLAKLGEERGAVSKQLQLERENFEKAVDALMEDQKKLLEDREKIQKELTGCQSVLARFQKEVLAKQEEVSATLSSALSPFNSRAADGRNSTVTNVLDSYIDNFDVGPSNDFPVAKANGLKFAKGGQLSFVDLSPDKGKGPSRNLGTSWSSLSTVSRKSDSFVSGQPKSSKSFARMKQELLEEQRILRQHLLEQEAALHEKQRLLHEKQLKVDQRMRNFDAHGAFSEDEVIKKMAVQILKSQQSAAGQIPMEPLVQPGFHFDFVRSQPSQPAAHQYQYASGGQPLHQSAPLNVNNSSNSHLHGNTSAYAMPVQSILSNQPTKPMSSSCRSSKGVQVDALKLPLDGRHGNRPSRMSPVTPAMRNLAPAPDGNESLSGSFYRCSSDSIRGTAEFHNDSSRSSQVQHTPRTSLHDVSNTTLKPSPLTGNTPFISGIPFKSNSRHEPKSIESDVLGDVFFIQ